MRLIDADALLEQMKELHQERSEEFNMTGDRAICVTWHDAVICIKDSSTIDSVPVVHGRWLWFEDCSNGGLYCSVCHKLIHKVMTPKKKLSRYCPNCGAKMDGGADNG